MEKLVLIRAEVARKITVAAEIRNADTWWQNMVVDFNSYIDAQAEDRVYKLVIDPKHPLNKGLNWLQYTPLRARAMHELIEAGYRVNMVGGDMVISWEEEV